MPTPDEKLLAQWRRSCGVWHVEIVVEGYDDIQKGLYRGDLSEGMVRAIAKRDFTKEFEGPAHIASLRRVAP